MSGLASLPSEPSLDYKPSDRQGLNTLTYTTQNTISQLLVNILYTGMRARAHTHTPFSVSKYVYSQKLVILRLTFK